MTGARVAQIWRYPVKSMAGERLAQVPIGPAGVDGDREWAFESQSAPPGMLRVSGRERRELLLYRTTGAGEQVLVKTPAGAQFSVSSPGLVAALGFSGGATLVRSATPQTDCRPLALVSLATIAALSAELFGEPGTALDLRQFRANLYIEGLQAWGEDALVGQEVRLGGAVLKITERDPRCRFFSLHPETAAPMPELMKLLDRKHGGRVGVYARVVTPGLVAEGDPLDPVT